MYSLLAILDVYKLADGARPSIKNISGWQFDIDYIQRPHV